MQETQQLQKSNQHKCPYCGGNLEFSAETGNLTCSYCGESVEIVRDKDVRERDFSEMKNQMPEWSQTQVESYRCKNCGAETIFAKNEIATKCPFCASSVVLDKSEIKTIKPDTVMPFEVDNETARKALLKWRKKRWLAPNKFRRIIEIDEMRGVYHPTWTFDSATTTHYRGRLGKRRTRRVGIGKNARTETYVEWFFVSGTIKNLFDDIVILANEKIDSKYVSDLEPFPQEKYCVYSDEYLAGYAASNYTVPPEQAYERAKARMDSIIRKQIKDKHHADEGEESLHLDTTFESQSFKYVMLPIYVSATSYKSKLYNQYVSGVFTKKGKDDKNVKVAGKSPLSWWKVLLLALGGLAVACALVYFDSVADAQTAQLITEGVKNLIIG